MKSSKRKAGLILVHDPATGRLVRVAVVAALTGGRLQVRDKDGVRWVCGREDVAGRGGR